MTLRAVKQNPELYWKLLNKPLVEISGCKTIYTGILSPWLNGLVTGSPEDASAVTDYFAQKNVPYSWWVDGASKKPAGLDYFGRSEGMELDLTALSTLSCSNVELELVARKETLEEFVLVLLNAYDAPNELFAPILALFLEAGFTYPRLHFIGRVEGEPVSICSIYIDEDKACSLYNVGTSHANRSKGYATELITKALYHAYQLGAKYSALTSFPKALNLYKRLGFKASYSFDIFLKI